MKTTRNIITLLAALPLLAGMTACSSDDESTAKPAKEMLRVIGGDIEMRAGEETAVVTIKADCHWKVQNIETTQFDGELTIQPREGDGNGTLVIGTNQNLSNSGRSATFDLVSDGGLKQRVTIVQTGGGDALNVSKKTFTFDAAPTAAQVLTINSNTAWRIQVPAGTNWLHLDKTSGSAGVETVQVTIDNAVTDAARSVSLPIVYGSESTEVIVQQLGMEVITLSVSANQLSTFGSTGGEQTFSVSSNAAWRVYVPTSAASWLHVEPAEGVGNGEVRVRCEANSETSERMSLIIVVAGTVNPKQQDILVQQSPGAGGYGEETISVMDITVFDQEVTSSSARLFFEFFSEVEVGQYGVCYSTTSRTPTVSDRTTVVGSGGREGFVEAYLENLNAQTTYYARGFVRIGSQVFYSHNVASFTTTRQ